MNKFFIRLFDFILSLLGLILLFPFFIIIAFLIVIDSGGSVFFKQSRVGKDNRDFQLLKFRTMKKGAEKSGLLTVGENDSRITRVGFFLRKYKLDELPQLVNVLKSEMSVVGPRPEVRKYVELYSTEQRKVLTVKPGITDFASIEYSNENELLGKSEQPDKTYAEDIMPAKIKLNMKFIEHPTMSNYFKIIGKTFAKVF